LKKHVFSASVGSDIVLLMTPWQKSAPSWCLSSISLIAHSFELTCTIRCDVLFCPKKTVAWFFVEKSCFACLFLQWKHVFGITLTKVGVGITLTKVSTKVMFVFTWSNLPSVSVQMNNLVWHIVFPLQTSDALFHWKILFFCGGFDRDIVVFKSPWQKSAPSWSVFWFSVSVVCHLESCEQTNLTCFWVQWIFKMLLC